MREKIGFLIILTCNTAVLLAQDIEKTDTKKSDEIVVTATRDERSIERAPYYADVIDSEEILLEEVPRTIPEALKHQTATLIQKTGHGQGSPYIRGFTGFRNLLLIDGIRLNNSVFRDGPNQYWNTVDPFSLDKIESIKGPFSVLYGSDAVGGTVSAFTRELELDPGVNWERRAYYRYSSAEDSHIGRIETSALLGENIGLTLGYTAKSFGDLEGGEEVGTQENTGYDEQDWDAKLQYFVNDDAWMIFSHQSVDIDDAWRTHKTIYGIDWEGLSVGKELRRVLDQDRRLTYLQFHQHNMDSAVDELHAGISHHLQEEERDRLRTNDRHDIQGFDVNTLGTFVQLKSDSAIGDLVYGTEFYHDDVDSYKNTYNPDGSLKSSSIQGPIADDATYDTLGVYLQDNISASDDISFLVGCRYDYAAADANNVEDPETGERIQIDKDWDNVVGSGRMLYHLDHKKAYNLFAGVSQGFRAPNLSDLTRLDSARTDEIETPSPDLEPEEFVSYEIGMKIKEGRLSGQVSYFYTDVQDMIVRTPTGEIIDDEYEVTKKNGGDGYVQGIEVSSKYFLLENLNAFGSFTWMDGKVETYPTSEPVLVEEYIDRLMPPTGEVGLHWDISKKYWLEGSCKAAGDADKLSTSDQSDTSRIPPGGTPGYVVGDIRAGWNVNKDIKLSLAIENITDEDYRIHGSGINEPGRNIILASDWKF